jgi:hypothetical protein
VQFDDAAAHVEANAHARAVFAGMGLVKAVYRQTARFEAIGLEVVGHQLRGPGCLLVDCVKGHEHGEDEN